MAGSADEYAKLTVVELPTGDGEVRLVDNAALARRLRFARLEAPGSNLQKLGDFYFSGMDEAALNAMAGEFARSINKLGKPVDRSEWQPYSG